MGFKCSLNCLKKPDSSPSRDKDRPNWASHWDYLLSLAGLAIGLGNVWRFPYLVHRNGGGAFLIPYVLMVALVGIPMFMLETSMAQFTSTTILQFYDICPALRGVGFAALTATAIATAYYCVLVAYPLLFIWHSFTSGPLPWDSCDNDWNTPDCRAVNDMLTVNESSEASFYDTGSPSSVEFFHKKVLQLSSGIEEVGSVVPEVCIANVIVWVTVFLSIFKGVKVLGKVVWFTALFPFVILLALLVRGLTLPGASTGLRQYLFPDFSKLLSLQVWADAAVQVFFSLGTGWGSLYCLGSYSRYRNNTARDAVMVPIVNGLTSFVAGLVVYSVLGFMAQRSGRALEDVAVGGVDLAFIAYPEAIAMMPGSHFWSVAFFLMLFFLGIDSCFVQVETVAASLLDYYPRLQRHKTTVTALVCLVIFMGSLLICTNSGMYWLVLLDGYPAGYTIIFVGLCEMIMFSYIYGTGRVLRDIQVMIGKKISFYWWVQWMYTCPILLACIFIFIVSVTGSVGYGDVIIPFHIQMIGLALAMFAILLVPCIWIYNMIVTKGNLNKRISEVHTPTKAWGPLLTQHRHEWQHYCVQFSSHWVTRYCTPTVPLPPAGDKDVLLSKVDGCVGDIIRETCVDEVPATKNDIHPTNI